MKSFASRAVCGERTIIRNAKELVEFYKQNMMVKSATSSKRPMLNRLFYYVSSTEMETYRDEFPAEQYNYIKGTLQIHQVVTDPGEEGFISYRKVSCGCVACLAGTYNNCEKKDDFKDCPEYLSMKKHTFKLKGVRQRKERNTLHPKDGAIFSS